MSSVLLQQSPSRPWLAKMGPVENALPSMRTKPERKAKASHFQAFCRQWICLSVRCRYSLRDSPLYV
jgi:hypothetical protein